MLYTCFFIHIYIFQDLLQLEMYIVHDVTQHIYIHVLGPNLIFSYCFTTQVLCKDKKMCTSPALLRFLGFDPHADKMYFKERREYLQRLEEATTEKVSA